MNADTARPYLIAQRRARASFSHYLGVIQAVSEQYWGRGLGGGHTQAAAIKCHILRLVRLPSLQKSNVGANTGIRADEPDEGYHACAYE